MGRSVVSRENLARSSGGDDSGPEAAHLHRANDSDPLITVARPEDAPGETKRLDIGSLIDGKYRLLRELGIGGMGVVYLAHNEALDVEVAVKVIRASLQGMQDPELAARLLQEARAAAQLVDPGIVRVFDLGLSSQGHPYIVMELLEGEDLAAVMDRRGPLDAVRAVQTILPVAHALAIAHERGIVHRDVKPENIFLARTEGGRIQPKLIDFGVAKLEPKTNTRLTAVGAMLGSPDYMSPEQARGLEVDHSTDIWSLCVVLYEMLVGQAPFWASNHNALMRTIIEERHASILSQGVGDEDLSAIIDRGLAKAPTERWPLMRELGKAAARWLLDRGHTKDLCGAPLERVWLDEPTTGPPHDGFDPSSVEAVSPPCTPLPWTMLPPAMPESGIAPEEISTSGAALDVPRPPARAHSSDGMGARPAIAAAALVLVVGGVLWLAPPDASSRGPGARAAASATPFARTTGWAEWLPWPHTSEPPRASDSARAPAAAADGRVPAGSSAACTDGTTGRPAGASPVSPDGAAATTGTRAPSPPSGTTKLPRLKTPRI